MIDNGSNQEGIGGPVCFGSHNRARAGSESNELVRRFALDRGVSWSSESERAMSHHAHRSVQISDCPKKYGILTVLHSHECGGAEKHALTLMAGLAAQGHRVAYAGPADSWLFREAKNHQIPAYHVSLHGTRDVYSIWKLVWIARRTGSDFLHGHLTRGAFYAAWSARLAGVPSIATAHSTNAHKHMKGASAVIAVSDAVKSFLVAKGIPERQISVVFNGIGGPQIETGESTRARLRQELGIDKNTTAVCMVARFIRDKGQDIALKALSTLSPDVRLFLIGKAEGSWYTTVKQLAETLLPSDRVVFLGHRENVLDLLQAMDLFIAPSRREALGLSIIEAMSAARPIVAAAVGGVPEIIADGVNGLLIPPEDPLKLAEAIQKLMSRIDLRVTLARNARKHFEMQFTVDTLVSATLAVYQRGLGT